MIDYSGPGLVLLCIALRRNIYKYIYILEHVCVYFISDVDSKIGCVGVSFIAQGLY